MKITIDAAVAAPIEEVWGAWTTPSHIEQWNAASDDWCCPSARLELAPGGGFSYRMEAKDGSMGFDFAGRFLQVEPQETIEYELGDGRVVRVEFIPEAGKVTVRQTFDADSTHDAEQQRAGWQVILDRFARHVESAAG